MINLGPLDFLTQYDLLGAIAILAGSLIVSKLFNLLVAGIVHHFAKKTKTTLDDEILHAIRRPIFFGILLLGLYLAAQSVHYLEPYSDIIDKIATVSGIVLLFYGIVRFMNGLFRWYGTEITLRTKQEAGDKYLAIVKRVIDVVVYIIAGIVLLRYFGVEITPLLASLGIGGLAVALALQDTFANFFAGFHTLTEKSIRVGDFIELESGLKGYVTDITWRTTRIKTLSDNFVIVPNSKLAQAITTNYHLGKKETSVGVQVGVSYNSDLEKVEKIAAKVAKEVQDTVKGCVTGYTPRPRFSEFSESSIRFSVALKVQEYADQFLARHEFIKRLKKEFDRNRIEATSPTRTVLLKK